MAGGRPPIYTVALGERVCELIANGSTLSKACQKLKISVSTVLKWVRDDPEFAKLYALAREAHAEVKFDELTDIADSGNRRERGGTERAKLRVDARKWVIVKSLPKKYGDKIEHKHEGGIKIVTLDQADADA